MLAHIKDESHVKKYPGFFPDDSLDPIRKDSNGIDAIICYSVFAYDSAAWDILKFTDCVMQIMNTGAHAIVGDCANISKRKRFYDSASGKLLFDELKRKTNVIENPVFNAPEYGELDDAVLESVVQRCRSFGFEAYLVPQPEGLAMWWEREDILIQKP